MMVALKSGMGVSRCAFAASIDEPQFWQNAFSSFTAVPHLGQLIINLIRRQSRLERPRALRPCGGKFADCAIWKNRGRLGDSHPIKKARAGSSAGARQYKQICPPLPVEFRAGAAFRKHRRGRANC